MRAIVMTRSGFDMKLYGIVRRKIGKRKLKVCISNSYDGLTASEDLFAVEEQLRDLTRSFGHTHEYVLVTFTGEEPL